MSDKDYSLKVKAGKGVLLYDREKYVSRDFCNRTNCYYFDAKNVNDANDINMIATQVAEGYYAHVATIIKRKVHVEHVPYPYAQEHERMLYMKALECLQSEIELEIKNLAWLVNEK